MQRLSITDDLTGVGNRRYLMTRLDAEIALCGRHRDDLAVVMLDLDHFKSINDTWGHPAGDRVLTALAKVLSNTCRATDSVARYGGEVFVLVLPRTTMDTALALLKRMRSELGELRVDGVDATITASFGVTTWQPDADALSLLSLADQGVYAAKTSGRDRICTCDGTHPR